MSKVEEFVKSSQAQATAAWIDLVNQIRINECVEKLYNQNLNFSQAIQEIEMGNMGIEKIISSNRGGLKGMHGFIAEQTEVSIRNARELVKGLKPEYSMVDNNGPTDIMRGGINIQVKFVQSDLSLSAIFKHVEKYPMWEGEYTIPKDYYDKIQNILNMPLKEAKNLTNNSAITRSEYKSITELMRKLENKKIILQPATIDYKETQVGVYEQTLENEKTAVGKQNAEQEKAIIDKSRLSLKEGAQVAAAGAGLEAIFSFLSVVYRKRKAGKRIQEFTEQDWKDVGIESLQGSLKGAIRGGSLYILTNSIKMPAMIANGFVTASFGMDALARKRRAGYLTEEEFLIESEILCMDVVLASISSQLGQVVIPIPMLGALIGNSVGHMMAAIAKEYLSSKDQELIEGFQKETNQLTNQLEGQYKEIVEMLQQKFDQFSSIVEFAFDEDVNKSFVSSIELAVFVDCDEDEILKSKEEIDDYFEK